MGPASEHPDGAGIVRPDGSTPLAPLADADCQAAAVAALGRSTALLGRGGVGAARGGARARGSRPTSVPA